MLLLPGIEGSPAVWETTAQALGARAHCPRLPSGPDLAAQAQALAATLEGGPWVVVGASYGGLLGWALADGAQVAVRALIVVGSLPSPSAMPRWMVPASRVAAATPDPIRRAAWRARLRAGLAADLRPGPWMDRIVAEADGWNATPDRIAAVGRWGLSARPAPPTLFLRGAADRECRWAVHDLVAMGWTARELPGAHRPFLRGQAGLAPLIDAAIAAILRGSPPW